MADKDKAAPSETELKNGAKAVQLYLRSMRRPERSEPGATLWFSFFYAVVALFPIVFAVGVASMLPVSDKMKAELQSASSHAAVAQVETEVEAALDAYIDPAPTGNSTQPSKEQLSTTLGTADLIDKLNDRYKAANAPGGLGGAKAAHGAYTSMATFAAAALIWAALLSVALASQVKLVWRQWDSLTQVEERNGYLATVPILAPVLFAGGSGWLMWYLQDWLALPPPLKLPEHWLSPYVAAGCAVALATMLFVSMFASMSAARNYPSPMAATRIARAFQTAATGRAKGTKASNIVIEYFEDRYPREAAEQAAGAVKPKAIPIAADYHSLLEARYPDLADGPRVDVGLSATQCLTIVSATSTLVAVVMVISLAMLSYGMTLLAAPFAGYAYHAEIKASANAWIMLLGAGMSVSLFAIYGLAYMRLKPFAETEGGKPAKPAAKGWSLSGIFKKKNVDLAAKPDKRPKPSPDLFAEYTVAMGATKAKFITILKGSNQGAAFHGLMEEGLRSQILKALGLLSPALAGGVLTFLG